MVNKLNSGQEGHTSNSGVEERRNSNDAKWADDSKTKPAKESSDEDPDMPQPQATPEHSGGTTPGDWLIKTADNVFRENTYV
jgi:hypothetical protein